jgi:2-C-methyl-D-erythritol 4-phosphate cytidylyltransferase
VVIHDAAHALAPLALFEAVIARVQAGAYAAVPVLPVVETLGRRGNDCLLETTPAGDAVLVQMPQAFRSQVLAAAYARGVGARDEASLLVESGTVVHVVPGDPLNIHITTAADLEVASRLAGIDR